MGDPKRLRKTYERSKQMWNKERIERDHSLKEKYGLKNIRELWKVTTEVSRIRRNVREVLSGASEERVGRDIISRLARYSIVSKAAKLDDLLAITPESILDRRLQTLVYKKGMAKSVKQARQLIAHGFVAIEGRRVKSPGYMVEEIEEQRIGYYKPINVFDVPQPQIKDTGQEAKPEAA